MIRYFCSGCGQELYTGLNTREVQDVWLNNEPQENVRMLWCDICQQTEVEVWLMSENEKGLYTCLTCAKSTSLPSLEGDRWLNPEALCYCSNIDQATDKNDYCSSWKGI